MSVKDFFQKKAEHEHQEIIEKDATKIKIEEELKINIQNIKPVMEKIYSTFSQSAREIKNNKYCCTLKCHSGTDVSSNESYTTEIILGGIRKENPMQSCKELNVIELREGAHIICRTGHDCKTITYSFIKTSTEPIHNTHSYEEILNEPELTEKYIENFLEAILG